MVAQYADEWNVWATPEIMAHKIEVLDQHCERLDRDPSTIQRSAVALLFLCDTEAQSAELRANELPRPSLIGTVAELQDQIKAFADLGVNEVIIPDFTLGEGDGKRTTSSTGSSMRLRVSFDSRRRVIHCRAKSDITRYRGSRPNERHMPCRRRAKRPAKRGH